MVHIRRFIAVMADKIGSRCEYGGHFGTVRYFGEIKDVSGLWYGIEWDEERGRHNGTYGGETYFSCSEGYGSFVRSQKVNFGISISEAIERRYGDLSDDIDRENMFFVGAKNRKTLVDVVGFDQVKKDWMQLKNLRKISLELMHVTGTNVDNDAQSLNTIIPNVRDLDLSRNLLRYWSDVTRIVFQLKKLQVLNISGNRLADLTDTTENPSLFESLETIFINRMSMTWNQVWFFNIINACVTASSSHQN